MTPERYHQIGMIFQAALECEPEMRASFLDEACGQDADLRLEVESLLSVEMANAGHVTSEFRKVFEDVMKKFEDESSMTGQSLGRYRIDSLLGEGGMGRVYLAVDTVLKRKVAIKFLPSLLTHDQDRVERFVREARAASALNHPNILIIHEIGEVNGAHYITTEFIDGETLRERLQNESLSLSTTLDLASQIATALAAAHEAGIVHRDIKPENVMVRRDGLVKVLDFGLAKLIEHKPSPEESEASIIAKANTGPGTVLGTASYMSPEQARGQDVDMRSDIFSLGLVLYEMIAGHPAFTGVNAVDVMGAILNQEPTPLRQLAPDAPPDLQRIVTKALRKDREQRYQHVKDLLIDLKDLKQELDFEARLKGAHTTSRAKIILSEIKRHKPGASVVLAILLAAVAGLGLGLYKLIGQNQQQPSSGEAPRIVPFTSYTGRENCPAFSPDGAQLAFAWVGDKGDNTDIYIKRIGGETHLRLTTNPAEDFNPVWSPDGNQIAFIRRTPAGAGVFVIPSLGGPERQLISNIWVGNFSFDNEDTRLAWSPDGRYMALSANADVAQRIRHIYLFSLDTRELRQITSLPAVGPSIRTPVFSPDGQTLAFIYDYGHIYLAHVPDGELTPLLREAQLIYGLGWMPDGKHIIFSSRRGGHPTLWKIPTSGGTLEQVTPAGNQVAMLTIARQGNRLAYTESILDSNIWRLNLSGDIAKQSPPVTLIASTQRDDYPKYSPDGSQISFTSRRSGHEEVWLCDSDGLNPVQLTSFNGVSVGSPRWSPDGRQIAFDSLAAGSWDIYIIDKGGGKPRRLTLEDSSDNRPSWSQDGRWIYFHSNRNGAMQVWKIPVAGGKAVQITTQGGWEAYESPDRQFVYYLKSGTTPGIWRVPVTGGEETKVLDKGQWGRWYLTNQGIYYIDEEVKPHPALEFFNFATSQTKRIAVINGRVFYGLAVSPDGRSILWSQVDRSESDLMLIENFR